ncbi:TlpA family protein disulfide reductase [Cochlodiniinecator piscidefendens]|uniref:TlpA family protein disulfide reductase n=1 Tax=Cochlodiniinecator piscidefendens TaxID=2715756 RepID=UPI00140A52EF|nr:TlpA disulfide reductase family protein [Cochlodiniinecator piscidefendens]
MRLFRSLVLYTALAFTATSASATSTEEILALREGLMLKLNFHAEPRPFVDTPFVDADATEHTLAEYAGKTVVLNFWATWCTPCRVEMPSLDRLQTELGGDAFEVVTIATGHNRMPAITRFFEQQEIENLPILLDPSRALAAEFGALSLPITVILNPEGQEIGRLIGDAEWDSESAIAILSALMENEL